MDPKSSQFQRIQLRRSEVLFKQGSRGSNFYVIEDGLIELQFDGRTRRLLKPGEFFGEIAPLAHLPRTATATALASTKLLEYSSDQLQTLLEENPLMADRIFSKFHGRLLQHSFKKERNIIFANDSIFENFLTHFRPRFFPKDETLCEEGDFNRNLYFIRKGSVSVIKSGEVLAKAEAGHFLGEVSAVYAVPRTATLKTLEPMEVLECSGSTATKILDEFHLFRKHLMKLALMRMKA